MKLKENEKNNDKTNANIGKNKRASKNVFPKTKQIKTKTGQRM